MFRKLCLIGLVGMVVLALMPWGRCCFDQLDAVQIGYVEDDGAGARVLGESMDTQRSDRAQSFIGGFFGSFYYCMMRYPPGAAAEWHIPAGSAFLLGFFFFRMLDRRQYLKGVAKMVAQRAAVDEIDYLTPRERGGGRASRSGSRPSTRAHASGDWSDAPDALELPPAGRAAGREPERPPSRDSAPRSDRWQARAAEPSSSEPPGTASPRLRPGRTSGNQRIVGQDLFGPALNSDKPSGPARPARPAAEPAPRKKDDDSSPDWEWD